MEKLPSSPKWSKFDLAAQTSQALLACNSDRPLTRSMVKVTPNHDTHDLHVVTADDSFVYSPNLARRISKIDLTDSPLSPLQSAGKSTDEGEATQMSRQIPFAKVRENLAAPVELSPFAQVNRPQLSDEQRQVVRKQLFKNIAPTIKGIRINRGFALLMEYRHIKNPERFPSFE